MSGKFPWGVLGIAPTDDRKAIRAAYAAKLKTLDVDADVAGYAELREARAEALYLAQQGVDAGAEPAPGDQPGDPLGDPFGEPQIIEHGVRSSGDTDTVPDEEAEPTDPKPAAFLALLFPGGEQSDEPLTAEQYAEAETLLHQIIADARSAQIDLQSGMEDWLAHYLAAAWPRSGPLVEDASTAFAWDQNAGRIDEDRAVAFLNDRLATIRRIGELDDPAHKYHEAWVELRKPGPKPRFAFRGPKRERVQELVVAIRRQHPELEEYLDGERVQSWIDPAPSGLPWATVFWIVVVLFGVARFFAASDPSPDIPVPTAAELAQGWPDEERQALADELFGQGVDYSTIGGTAPALYNDLVALTRMPFAEGLAKEFAYSKAREQARARALLAAKSAEFSELVAIKQYRLDLMRAARAQGGAAWCMDVTKTLVVSEDFAPDEAFAAKEQALLRRVYDAGLFVTNEDKMPTSAPIPGTVVEQVMDQRRSVARAVPSCGTGPRR